MSQKSPPAVVAKNKTAQNLRKLTRIVVMIARKQFIQMTPL